MSVVRAKSRGNHHFSTLSPPLRLLFAVIVLLIRPPVFLASLAGSDVERWDRLLIAWFGPRGFSSLLLVLLPVFAGLPGSDRLFAICCLVVLLSVALHNGSPIVLARIGRRQEQQALSDSALTPAEESLQVTPTSVPSVAGDENSQVFIVADSSSGSRLKSYVNSGKEVCQ